MKFEDDIEKMQERLRVLDALSALLEEKPKRFKDLQQAARIPFALNTDLKSRKSLKPFLSDEGKLSKPVLDLMEFYPTKFECFNANAPRRDRLKAGTSNISRKLFLDGITRADRDTRFKYLLSGERENLIDNLKLLGVTEPGPGLN